MTVAHTQEVRGPLGEIVVSQKPSRRPLLEYVRDLLGARRYGRAVNDHRSMRHLEVTSQRRSLSPGTLRRPS